MTSRKPPKRERVAALLAAGWQRIGSSQMWVHARYPATSFTLAAAERTEQDPDWWRARVTVKR